MNQIFIEYKIIYYKKKAFELSPESPCPPDLIKVRKPSC